MEYSPSSTCRIRAQTRTTNLSETKIMKFNKAALIAALTAFSFAAPACDEKKDDKKEESKKDEKKDEKADEKAEEEKKE
jgi:hypothetical protein